MINPIDNLMHQYLTAIALLCYATTCIQLLCYRRGKANYRINLSCIAWLLIALNGSCALEILLGNVHISLGQTVLAFTLCVLVHHAKGNVANVLREIYDYTH
ncbi:phage holin family protein [Glaciimonas sp. PCH181]|uniref:phage holin family protein n=1 Tax=Glaciimonas sp. PCH181 TaxID=2133943 RepID=UPI000D3598A8|nr:phage holin family protein [Glaciimonas sp. PCH181]PUA16816.1 phage holin family protein [Glaciimonas sp. PCH181]